jgi:hypothetical protein
LKTLSAAYSLEYPDLVMLVDMLRSADDGGNMLFQLVQSIGMVRVNPRTQDTRRKAIGLFADVFASMNETVRLKELFSDRLIDPAYNDYYGLISMNVMLTCYNCILLAQQIFNFIQNYGDEHDAELELPDIGGIIDNPVTFERAVHIVSSQSSSLDVYMSASNLDYDQISELRHMHQMSRNMIADLKSAFTMILRFPAFLRDGNDTITFYIAYLSGSDQRELVWPFLESSLQLMKENYEQASNLSVSIGCRSAYLHLIKIALNYISKSELAFHRSEASLYYRSATSSARSHSAETAEWFEVYYGLLKEWMEIEVKSSATLTALSPISTEVVLISYTLYNLRKLGVEDYIRILFNACETFPFPQRSSTTDIRSHGDNSQDRFRLTVWLLLADAISSFSQFLDMEESIESDLSTGVVSSGFAHLDAQRSEYRDPSLFEERSWWCESILASSSISNYFVSITNLEIEGVFEVIEDEALLAGSLLASSLNDSRKLENALNLLLSEATSKNEISGPIMDEILPPIPIPVALPLASNAPSTALSGYNIQLLVAMTIVNAYISMGQDSLFAAAALQALLRSYWIYEDLEEHAMSTYIAGQLKMMSRFGVDIRKAFRIGQKLGDRKISIFDSIEPSANTSHRQQNYDPL